MIHIACKDMAAGESAAHVQLNDQLLYVAKSFSIDQAQLHDSPPPGFDVVLIQPADGEHVEGTDSLVPFVHPEDCVYLFGGSDSHLTLDGIVPVSKIYIPHVATWNMFASQAAAIVLYDRYVKRGGFG